jgi:hypothetical protein
MTFLSLNGQKAAYLDAFALIEDHVPFLNVRNLCYLIDSSSEEPDWEKLGELK